MDTSIDHHEIMKETCSRSAQWMLKVIVFVHDVGQGTTTEDAHETTKQASASYNNDLIN
jgi:hypothetical protein